ncbi:MAG TPA: glycerophosphodiester phosphodiesterase [Gemmatimonadaceae bacterium]|nr:glycerophosphodiester phosphodiesterase [Gemmatimonadaceae bacterium]
MTPSTGVERVAHRGAPRELLENTLPSFARALERGADAIELDVHVTSDGVVVVHHDEKVRGRPILGTPWAEIERLELRAGARVPRLDDVFEIVADRATLYIELKGRGVALPAIEVARRAGAGRKSRYAMHSFDHSAIELAATTAPEIARGVLLDKGRRDAVAAMRAAVARTGARDVWPHWSLVDTAFMSAAKDVGARVIVWTVNARGRATRLRDLGVDALCTDDVTLLDQL